MLVSVCVCVSVPDGGLCVSSCVCAACHFLSSKQSPGSNVCEGAVLTGKRSLASMPRAICTRPQTETSVILTHTHTHTYRAYHHPMRGVYTSKLSHCCDVAVIH